jgi:hypothetical protein
VGSEQSVTVNPRTGLNRGRARLGRRLQKLDLAQRLQELHQTSAGRHRRLGHSQFDCLIAQTGVGFVSQGFVLPQFCLNPLQSKLIRLIRTKQCDAISKLRSPRHQPDPSFLIRCDGWPRRGRRVSANALACASKEALLPQIGQSPLGCASSVTKREHPALTATQASRRLFFSIPLAT